MNKKVMSEDSSARKPAGGFCLVSGTALYCAWEAYRRGDLRLRDLRVWFACLELVARRCGIKEGRAPKYRIEELHGLVGGVGGMHLRASIRRLQSLGLLTWSVGAILLPRSDVAGEMIHDLSRLDALASNHRRLVPVPRRIVRLIAGNARRVVIATILGHLLRCLYYRGGVCHGEGTCKASWIAELFDVSVRNVKTARQGLVSMGWLVPIVTRQTVLNRFGQRNRVNLEWSGNDISGMSKRSPRRPFFVTESAPPYENKKLSTRIYMNQKPANGPAGICKKTERAGEPTLRNVVWDDLQDAHRLKRLYREATVLTLVNGSECERLHFFAAAEHAKAVGTRNPCGLFIALVRRRQWHFITQADEESARGRLRKLISEGRRDQMPSAREVTVAGPAWTPNEKAGRLAIRSLITRSLSERRHGDGNASSRICREAAQTT